MWFEWMQSDAFLCDKHTIFSFPLFWVIWSISFLLTCSFNAFLEIFILTDPNNKLIRTVHWLVYWLEQFWFEIVYNFGRLKYIMKFGNAFWNLVPNWSISTFGPYEMWQSFTKILSINHNVKYKPFNASKTRFQF